MGRGPPTVRLRLDRLIQKVKVADQHGTARPFERKVRALFADGRFDMETLRTLLAAHEEEQEGRHAEDGKR